jgi:hypothetical protein
MAKVNARRSSLEETLAIMSKPEVLRKVKKGTREVEAGLGTPLEKLARRRSSRRPR